MVPAYIGLVLWIASMMGLFIYGIPITINEIGSSMVLILYAIYLEVFKQRKDD